jgi:hypothetical protein
MRLDLRRLPVVNPVKIFHMLDVARALKTVRDQVCGLNLPASLANYDPDSSLWKTSQRCLLEGWTLYSGSWPRSGTMRGGIVYQLKPLVPLIGGTGCLLWPTPVARDDGKTPEAHMKMKANMKGGPRYKCTSLTVMVKGIQQGMWPTPRASVIAASATMQTVANIKKPRGNLEEVVYARTWPTPRASEAAHPGRKVANHNGQKGLAEAVNQFPTPTANRRDGLQSHGVNVVSGSLNPDWVEALMGFPPGWSEIGKKESQGQPPACPTESTDLGPSEMP